MLLVERVPAEALRGVEQRLCDCGRLRFGAVFREFHVVVGGCAEEHRSFGSAGDLKRFPGGGDVSVAENAESRVEAHAVILGGAGVYECVIFSGYRRCVGLVEGEPEIERALFRSGEPERDDPCGVACERLVGESHSALGESAGVQRLVQIKAAAVGAYLPIGEREVEHRVAEEQVAAEIPVAGEHREKFLGAFILAGGEELLHLLYICISAAVVSAVVVGARRAGTARPERLFVEDDALLFDTAEHAGAHVSVAYRKAGLFPQPEVAGVVKIDLVGSAHIFISF